MASSNDNLAVLNAIDTARTQWYHITAIVIAGMGFFTDAYDLFCISTVSKLLGRLYYFDPTTGKTGQLPTIVNNMVVGVALVGTLSGQLVFGWLGDKLGRKKVYGITLILMVTCAIFSGISFGSTAKSVIGCLCFFRFWLGFGIGGDYPLSATIMCEYANKKTRGAFIAAVFAMQGRFLWRIVLMVGAFPAALTYYWRMKMPETGRYTALVQGNAKQAAMDMGRVLEIEIEEEQDKVLQFKAANEYPLLSNEFYKRHGVHLIEEVYENPRMFIVALFGTFPGYWFTVVFIENLGRFTIQLLGFFMMSVFMLVMGIKYEYLKDHKWLFALLYGLTFFFANFGPNSTTFVFPAELFPTRVRSTCHALSAAAGKAGAMIGAFVVQSYTLDERVPKIKHALMVLAFTNMLGFCCTFLLPETKGRSLEEISGEDGGQDERYVTVKPPALVKEIARKKMRRG
ncbi:hypothetical protein GH714_028417 [Hevea brasiliensis]|uniref:Major facilitator superfamily (MFS) profile domain-containing protein n=1 Tax=Hevea brasiliensis TaxID=3981 RepID=A0A6A6MES4_HEVBR|nr:hypothetical protein GH714_028417 [Hevea brasiliensis]